MPPVGATKRTKRMKNTSLILKTMGIAWLTSWSLSVGATPSWWDDYQFRQAGSGTIELGGGGSGSGSLDILMSNLANPTATKFLYLVLDWEASDSSATFLPPVYFSVPPYTVYNGGVEVVSTYDPISGNNHWEYSFSIFPQPPEEVARIFWTIGTVGSRLDYSFDFRSRCPDGASTLGMMGLALLGLLRCRSSRS